MTKINRSKFKKLDLEWDGKSVWYSSSDVGIPGGCATLWMLAEDAGTEVWSHFYRDRNRELKDDKEQIWLDNCSDDLEEVLVSSISREMYRDSVVSNVRDFVKMIASQLVVSDCISFEVQGGWAHSDGKRLLMDANLSYLQPASIISILGRTWQIVPMDALCEVGDKRVRQLNSDRVIEFKRPRKYQAALRQICKSMPIVADSKTDLMRRMSEGRANEDYKKVIAEHDLRVAKMTNAIGWNGRGMFHDYMADYQCFDRRFTWAEFCIHLREEILATLSAAFARIGTLRGESPILRWRDVPTLTDVEDARKTLSTSGGPFMKMFKSDDTEESD